MFLDLLTGDEIARMGEMFDDRFAAAWDRWRGRQSVVLHDAVAALLCDTTCACSGAPVADAELTRRTRKTTTMIAGAGSAGPRAWRWLSLVERWPLLGPLIGLSEVAQRRSMTG